MLRVFACAWIISAFLGAGGRLTYANAAEPSGLEWGKLKLGMSAQDFGILFPGCGIHSGESNACMVSPMSRDVDGQMPLGPSKVIAAFKKGALTSFVFQTDADSGSFQRFQNALTIITLKLGSPTLALSNVISARGGNRAGDHLALKR